jgi:hypothetical protein
VRLAAATATPVLGVAEVLGDEPGARPLTSDALDALLDAVEGALAPGQPVGHAAATWMRTVSASAGCT